MTCSRCQTINPQGAVACAACGAPLVAMPMMQQPVYGQPGQQPYVMMQPMAHVRSGIPKVMGILMIVFASLIFLLRLANISQDPAEENPILAELDSWSSVKSMFLVFGVMDLGLCVLHLVAGIRSVGYKRNGPGLSMAYAIASIVTTIVQLVAVYAWLKPLLDAIPGTSSAVIGAFMGIGVVSAVWPIIVLVLMSRPSAKQACVN